MSAGRKTSDWRPERLGRPRQRQFSPTVCLRGDFCLLLGSPATGNRAYEAACPRPAFAAPRYVSCPLNAIAAHHLLRIDPNDCPTEHPGKNRRRLVSSPASAGGGDARPGVV